MDPERILYKDFHKNHQVIEETVYAILGSIRAFVLVKPRLAQLSEQMSDYLSYQDQAFYDYLNKKCANDKQALKMLEFLSCDLRYITDRYMKFFDKFAENANELTWMNFPREFSAFSRELMSRFQVEKEYLIPLLEKLRDQASGDGGRSL